MIPFAFWSQYPTYTFPATTTVITSANYTSYINRNWVVPNGATVNISYNLPMNIGSLTMASGGQIVHPACESNPCAKINLTINGNAIIPSGAAIDTYGSGYLGGYSATNGSTTGMTTGNTTTGGSQERTGGSHGGYGSYAANATTNVPAAVFDNYLQPYDFGGGGGGSITPARVGGGGGGVIRLNITGDLTLDGVVASDGYDGQAASGSGSGGGAGGSIWITCRQFMSHSTNILSAAGGSSSGAGSAGGGGGLIAIYYQSLGGTMAFDFSHISINGGIGNNVGGGSGILYVQQTASAYGDIYFDNQMTVTTYQSTPFPQPSNMTYNSINLSTQADVKQLLNSVNVTATTTNVGVSSVLRVPTNGGSGYGSWFVPGTVNLTGSPIGQIVEY